MKSDLNKTLIIPIALEITNRCFSACRHCYLSCEHTGEDIPFSQIKKIIKKFEKTVKVNNEKILFTVQSLTGGDPFLYKSGGKNLSDIIKLLLGEKKSLDVHVSGWFVKPDFFEKLEFKKIRFFMTYTPYMKEYREKFSITFKDLEKNIDTIHIDIVSTVPEKNSLFKELLDLLKEMDYKFIDNNKGVFELLKEGKKVFVYFRKIFPFGRGKNLVKNIPDDCRCIYGKEDRNFFVTSISRGICTRALKLVRHI